MIVTTLLMNLWPCQRSKSNQNYLKPSKCVGLDRPVKRSSTCTISLRETVSVRMFVIKRLHDGCNIADVHRKKIMKLAFQASCRVAFLYLYDDQSRMEVTGSVSKNDSSSLTCVQLCRLEKTIFQKSTFFK